MSEYYHRNGDHVVVINPANHFYGAAGIVVPTVPHSGHIYVDVKHGADIWKVAFLPDELYQADVISRLARVGAAG